MNTKVSIAAAIGVLALLAAACTQPKAAPIPMGGMPAAAQAGNLAPPVGGFYRGGEVLFIHTEASDPQVASMLTQMMGPQVVLLPGLAQSPQSLLAAVYGFTNGVKGAAPSASRRTSSIRCRGNRGTARCGR